MSRAKDFPNNWKSIRETPPDRFDTCTFEEFMTYRVANWEIPSSICCIIRVEDTKTKKISEFSYQRKSAAQKKIESLLSNKDIAFTVADDTSIHLLSQNRSHLASFIDEDEEDEDK